MGIYYSVRKRMLGLMRERKVSIHKLSIDSAVAPSSIKNILYGRSQNPGIVTLKMLCDGLGVSLVEFFDHPLFNNIDPEVQ